MNKKEKKKRSKRWFDLWNLLDIAWVFSVFLAMAYYVFFYDSPILVTLLMVLPFALLTVTEVIIMLKKTHDMAKKSIEDQDDISESPETDMTDIENTKEQR